MDTLSNASVILESIGPFKPSTTISVFESGHLNSCTISVERLRLPNESPTVGPLGYIPPPLFAVTNAATDIAGSNARIVLCAMGLA